MTTSDEDAQEIKRVRTAKTFYQQLAVSDEATEDDVKKAYHRLAKKLVRKSVLSVPVPPLRAVASLARTLVLCG